ncbi:hypothetical protein TNIN_345321 [Trichonephila inaurata madagascariensis]|uniref:Uncharacterized protein n=1 Tax=Trichonephila inaurata madagascariensis TaxID=2747483 RepID=A0A8X7CS52_9ARAC|nr:hypothetical protein TNIN_345321 [Trichonephila inaurata madagascariensis]
MNAKRDGNAKPSLGMHHLICRYDGTAYQGQDTIYVISWGGQGKRGCFIVELNPEYGSRAKARRNLEPAKED